LPAAPHPLEVEPGRWDDLRSRLGVTDVYSARGYLEASAVLTGGEPVYLHHDGVLFAALLRPDPVDVTTPYGYGGPIAVGDASPAGFADPYAGWCAARGVVSSFLLYHPLHGNAAYAGETGFRTTPLDGTVAWRLEGDLVAGMHRHHRRLVRRAEGLDVRVTPRPTDLDAFVGVYEATMRRAGASPFYLFPPGYWRALVEKVPLVRVDVLEGDDLAASVLGMGEPPWLHYHLGGSTEEGRRAGASHLALLALARWGAENGYTVLHLGGGVGGRRDSLYEFKLRFAPDGHLPGALGKAVHDLAAYERLTGRPGVDWDGFFPAYRESR
jgi:serine/alanine adding enzyme